MECVPLPLHLPPAVPLAPVRGELLHVGRLEVRKGVVPLVRTCAARWAEGADFGLTLIGADRAYAPRGTTVGAFLRDRHARWIEAGRLRLLGQVARDDVLHHMATSWALLVPSLWDNFPNTCMEAMGIGQVVLASMGGGQAEMIGAPAGAGVLFDWSVEGDFAVKLGRVLALGDDERRAIGEAARDRIRSLCDPTEILARRVAHFERVMASRVGRRWFPGVADADGAVPPPSAPAVAGEIPGLVSIVIPFHNLGAYVGAALDSALASTHAPLEVVVVDDGSDDPASLEALGALEHRRDPRVRVLRTPNRGLAAARNAGAAAARGEFLAFLDADDLIEPAFLAHAVDVMRAYANVGLVYSWVRYFGDLQGFWPTWNTELPYLLAHNMLTPLAVVRRAPFLACATNRSELEFGLEDWESWIRLVSSGWRGVSLAAPLVCYRVREGSMYRSLRAETLLYLYEVTAELHADLYRRWGPELLNLVHANGPPHTWDHPAADPRDDSPYDDELGGKLVRRVRASWLGQQLLRYGPVRRGLKRALGV
jgi:hypothetical protein